MSGPQANFWEHLDELRILLIRCIIIATVGCVVTFIWRNQVIETLTWPVQQLKCHNCAPSIERLPLIAERLMNTGEQPVTLQLAGEAVNIGPGETHDLFTTPPSTHGLVLFSPAEGFNTTLSVCFWSGLTITSPLWLALICGYVAPAISKRGERRIPQFVALSTLFMGIGALFALKLTIPTANRFFHSFNQGLGVDLWSLGNYLNYTLFLMLASALAFEIAALALFLVYLGKITASTLQSKRKLAVLLIVIGCAVLTPPDVVSQLLLAVPMLLLYEATILYARVRG